MNKIARIMTLALVVFSLASCEDVPSPFGTVTPPKKGAESSDIEPTGSGTAADPFNVQKAINYVKELGADVESSSAVYVKGKVLSISEISSSFGNASFVLSDDADGSNKFTAYRVKGFNNQKITDENMLKVGDEVVVCGKIVNYRGNTPETVQNSAYIYSVNGNTGGGGSPEETTAEAKGSGTQADPYNVAGVLKFIGTLGADNKSSNEVYIKGKVKEVKEQFGTQYGNATFTMIDEGYTAKFTAYRILYFNNQKYTSGDGVKEGDEVIVCGKVVNYQGNTPETVQGSSYLFSLNGKTGEGGSSEPTGEAKGSGTQADPYNVVAIAEICAKLADKETSTEDYYIKGKICSIKYEFSAQYGTATFNISDNGQTGGTEFTAYSVYYLGNAAWTDGNTQIAVGNEVILCGKITNYGGTLETASKKAYIYSLNGKTKDEGGSTGGNTETGDADITAAFGDLNCSNLEAIALSDGTTLSVAKEDGNNEPVYHESSKIIRMYARNSITINAGSKKISKVEFTYDTYNGNAYKGNDEMYGEAGSNKLTPTKTDVTVTFSNVSNSSLKVVNWLEKGNSGGTQFRISKIAITYVK